MILTSAIEPCKSMASTSKTTTVDKSKHGIVIGKGGATIKDLETKFGVKIVLPKDDSSTITVNGAKAAEAIEAIQALVAPKGDKKASSSSSSSSSTKASSSSEGSKSKSSKESGEKVVKVLKVPAEDHKYIVGAGGATVKAIREESGADVQISTNPDQVTITGSDEKSVKKAEKLVKEAIAKVHDQHEATEGWYQKYQKEIDEHAKKREEYFEQAKKAHDAGNGALAKELSEKGKAETALMEKAQIKAARAVFEKRNKDNGPDVIDLHGLQVDGAVLIASEWLDKQTKKPVKGKEINIITGKGLHSDAAGPKILPAIEKLLTERKLKHEAVAGGFKITL